MLFYKVMVVLFINKLLKEVIFFLYLLVCVFGGYGIMLYVMYKNWVISLSEDVF